MKTKYMAQWYEDDAFRWEDGEAVDFEPDVMHHSYHDTLDDAKRAAFINASRGDAVGVAYAHIIEPPLSDVDDVLFVNEIYNGQWNGWEQRA